MRESWGNIRSIADYHLYSTETHVGLFKSILGNLNVPAAPMYNGAEKAAFWTNSKSEHFRRHTYCFIETNRGNKIEGNMARTSCGEDDMQVLILLSLTEEVESATMANSVGDNINNHDNKRTWYPRQVHSSQIPDWCSH